MDESPNLPGHDFPTASGNQISPVGNMFLEKRAANAATQRDELGHEHFVFPRSGESFAVNSVQKFHPLTIQTHANDLMPLLIKEVNNGKTMAVRWRT